MRKNSVVVCILLALVSLGIAQPVGNHQASALSPVLLDGWQPIVDGVEYREFYLSTPDRLYVTRMDRNHSNLILESGIGQGTLLGGSETVSAIANRYDQAVNYWGEQWGARNQVVAAVNGYFFDPETGIPGRGQVQSGWYAKRFDNNESGSGFVWTLGRQVFVGGCITHPAAKQYITYLSNGETQPFSAINGRRTENDLVIYTPQYAASTNTDDSGLEVLVELSRPLLIMPEPAMITGTVRQVRDGLGNSWIPFDHIVLSAGADKVEKLRQNVSVGEIIGVSQEIKHYNSDCQTPADAGWEKTYAAIGASFMFLQQGRLQGFDDLGALLRSPRTAVAYDERHIYFIVADGRDRFHSIGMSIVELGVFAKQYLGATWAAALDGGGSSTMVVNGELKNRPNLERDESGAYLPTERVVGNALMMIAVKPKEQSVVFQAGDEVQTAFNLQLRLGPGINYAALAQITPGRQGRVLEHSLNGVLASGYHWWKVDFGEVFGWVAEDLLMLVTPQ